MQISDSYGIRILEHKITVQRIIFNFQIDLWWIQYFRGGDCCCRQLRQRKGVYILSEC